MNSQDTSSQIQAIEAAIEKLTAKPAVAQDGTTSASAAQSMQKENLQSLKQDLMHQVKLNQDQMIKDQMEQARLRSELAYKEQLQQARALQEQTQRDRETQAKLRREQIERYEQQQTKLKQDQFQRDQLEQTKRRQEQMQRDREQQARLKQEQLQREQQLQARLKQEQMQREKAKQEQIQKERAQQEKAKQEQIQAQKNLEDQRNLILAQRLKEERARLEELKNKNQSKDSTGEKKIAKNDPKIPRTPEQLAKDEEARAFSSRTEMSLASIAFCSPLMLFGMGAAMSIFDNFAGGKKNPALLEARRKNQQNMELSEYARLEADKKFNEMVERNNLINKSSVTDVNATKFGKAMKGAERKEEKPRVNRFVAAEATPMPAARKNDSLEVKKLWKERQRLLENLERVRGQGSLALVSKLVSQLETLDRSLKRLGCDPQA